MSELERAFWVCKIVDTYRRVYTRPIRTCEVDHGLFKIKFPVSGATSQKQSTHQNIRVTDRFFRPTQYHAAHVTRS